MCVVPILATPALLHHRPLLACGSTTSCSARLTVATATRGQGGLSLSAYLRVVGLNHPIQSVADLDAVADLVRVNGDLGRVAGLLKLWLAEKRGQGARPVDVESMMREFRAQQAKLSAIMGKVALVK